MSTDCQRAHTIDRLGYFAVLKATEDGATLALEAVSASLQKETQS